MVNKKIANTQCVFEMMDGEDRGVLTSQAAPTYNYLHSLSPNSM